MFERHYSSFSFWTGSLELGTMLMLLGSQKDLEFLALTCMMMILLSLNYVPDNDGTDIALGCACLKSNTNIT